MLLGLIIILGTATVISFCRHKLRLGWLAAILFIVTQGVLLLDTQQHFATKSIDRVTIAQIRPIASIHGNHIMVTKKIKQGKTTYTAYAAKRPGKTAVQLILNKHKRVVINHAPTNANQLVTQSQERHYTNQGAKWLFWGITNQNQLEHQVVTYRLKDDWVLLSKTQLKAAAKRLKSSAYRASLKHTVKSGFQSAAKQHPQLLKNPQQVKQLQNRLAKRAIGNTLRQYQSA